jgi:predicted RNase H-like HicB family nuclease
MAQVFFPAILWPADAAGLFGVTVPNINVNGSGPTAAEALADATTILQEVIDDLAADRSAIPPPATVEPLGSGQWVLLPALLPSPSVRVNITLPADLLARIDAVSPNRSAFLAKWAAEGLRAGR